MVGLVWFGLLSGEGLAGVGVGESVEVVYLY